MEPHSSPQQSALVREVLVQRSHGHSGPRCHTRRRQFLLADSQQNLNSRLENRVYTRGGTRLEWRFSWLWAAYCLLRQMRTPNLKLSSSKHIREPHSESLAIGDTYMTKQTQLGGTFNFPGTTLTVQRVGYGAMQLAGPRVLRPAP